MIANHPSWEAPLPPPLDDRKPRGGRASGGPGERRLSPVPTLGQAITRRVVGSPWTILAASLALGVLAGCLVKRR